MKIIRERDPKQSSDLNRRGKYGKTEERVGTRNKPNICLVK